MTRFKACGGVSAIAILTVLAGGLAAAPALAQTRPAADAPRPKLHFAIPPGSLASALNRFAEVTGVQLVYPSSLVQGLSSPGLSGDFTPGEALQRLVAGTGLSTRMLSATSATLEPPPVGGSRTLGAIQVEGVQTTGAFLPLTGFGPGAGSNGSSDPTATEGTGSLTTNGAGVASKTPESLKDTPQSVTVITSELIQQQNMTDLTSALAYTPGITLDTTGGLATNFLSRGFQITTFQIDGGGSINMLNTQPNLGEFDSIQVLRGSDALFGGTGAPGGEVNLERKRPLDHEQLIVDADAGSWDNYRIQADATGPIAFDGHVRARLVVSYQDRDFFYDLAHQTRPFVYGVVEADLGPNTIARAGFSYESQTNTGYNQLGLPRYSDGSDLGLPRSTSLSAPWNKYNTITPEFFAALEHRFNHDWGLKLNFTRSEQDLTNEFAQNIGVVNRSPAPSSYEDLGPLLETNHTTQYAADATLNGKFKLFGLDQSLIAGADFSDADGSLAEFEDPYTIAPKPLNVFSFNPASLNPAPPPLQPYLAIPNGNTEQWGAYFKLNLQPIQNLHISGGFRYSNYWETQTDVLTPEDDLYLLFGLPPSSAPVFKETTSQHQTNVVTPYGSVSYGLTPDVSVYASYADIFQEQAGDLGPTGQPLPPMTGDTYEAGVKGAFKDGKLNASLSVYYTDESNYGLQVTQAGCAVPANCWLDTGAVVSKGADLELSGEILPGWQIQAGYNYNLNVVNAAYKALETGVHVGTTFQTQQPKDQLKLWTSYTPIGRFDHWTVGGGFRLESARFTSGDVCTLPLNPATGACPGTMVPFAYTQGLYTVMDLRVAYKINNHWQAAVNLTNIYDTRYYQTAGSNESGNFYGEPRAFMFSIRATY